jgi:hypothetical protein
MPDTFVGIQIGAISFVDEGVEQVLDLLQEIAKVNALLISALTWSRGNAGRATEGYPDHGHAEPDNLQGGAFWEPDSKYYSGTFIKDFKAPDPLLKGFDTFRDVIPAAKKRGMKVYPYYCETANTTIRSLWQPGWHHILEIDSYGRKGTRPCLNNPDYRAFKFSVIEDWFKNHDLSGFLWGIERQGPLMNMLGGDVCTCFCRHCRTVAAQRNIDAEAAIRGYQAVEKFLQECRAGKKPLDGYFITFLRLLLHHPEIFLWEKLWLDAHKSMYHEIHGLVKFFGAKYEMGLGLWQEINTFNPYLRAQHDYQDYPSSADWIKPVLYHVPAGARFRRYLEGWHKTILGDASPAEWVEGFFKILGRTEANYNDLPTQGFSADYVRQETKRLIDATSGKVKIYPGIGVGVPSGPGGKFIAPADVKASVRASFEGGASGVLISRNYSEALLENVAAVGEALRELGY